MVTNLKILFTPTHRVTKHAVIEIRMPLQVAVGCALEGITNLKEFPFCVEKQNNYLEFHEPFMPGHDEFLGNIPLSFTFKDVQLPGSEKWLQGIEIRTFQLVKKDGRYTD